MQPQQPAGSKEGGDEGAEGDAWAALSQQQGRRRRLSTAPTSSPRPATPACLPACLPACPFAHVIVRSFVRSFTHVRDALGHKPPAEAILIEVGWVPGLHCRVVKAVPVAAAAAAGQALLQEAKGEGTGAASVVGQ